MGQDLSDVVAAGAEHEEHGTADGAVQGASRQAAIGLHVANLCLDGASTSFALNNVHPIDFALDRCGFARLRLQVFL
jgi:hypothetical protein